MHLQGNLQTVFDALYTMGVIDPVLRMDWQAALKEREPFVRDVQRAVKTANRYCHDMDRLMAELGKFDDKTLHYLAMEVAREYADFHARKELH